MDWERTRTVKEPSGESEAPAGGSPGLVVLFSAAAIPGDGIYPARAELSIGRSPDCTVFLEDAGLSRFHAVVRFDGATVTVRDAGSHNGTFRNTTRVGGEVSFGPGDVLRCGETLLTVAREVERFKGWRRWGLRPA